MNKDFGTCRECRTVNGSCRSFVIGHPNPVCVAGYPRHRAVANIEGLDLLIPAPRNSPENVPVR